MMHNSGMTSTTTSHTRALVITEPQPVWMTLNEARERAFTGEIVFELDPEVVAYLDYGVVYYAERAGDPSLGQRLLEAGLLDDAQLRRGAVRVGEVEHLGRLFDRDGSVERDAVVVATERFTEELLSELANSATAMAHATAYRHHPSGVHRWFVAPADGAMNTPIGDVAHLDPSAVDELPGLPVGSSELLSDELHIEWDMRLDLDDELDVGIIEFSSEVPAADPLTATDPLTVAEDPVPSTDDFVLDMDLYVDDVAPEPAVAHELVTESDLDADADPETDSDLQADADHAVASTDDDVVADDEMIFLSVESELVVSDVADDEDSDVESERGLDDLEFEVTWPDGSAAEMAADESAHRSPMTTDDLEASADAQIEETDDGGFHFEMPPLVIDDGDGDPTTSGDAVPDDVADAVRRALAAIETATAQSASVAPLDARIDVSFDTDEHETAEPEAEPRVESIEPDPAPASWSSFAPPTLDMRAEMVYAQAETVEADAFAGSALAAADDSGPGDGDRTSALKRLIGSLRRKDR